ncbi:TetR/AcrR family transcriptional regulator [Nocardia alni]|uniref:TetR/AcrR family transcriptional regulator n=1 Tax=Nocardia alni TaxID=2815723 RepID=UPI001C2389A5|nr:TetR/AcrR family transcriptional regulator [Nocardia alni]
MTIRAESAAHTRQDLLDAASDLLDLGGPGAVTLREVGRRAGVSRTAPYRHFADKETLLMALAAEAWDGVAEALDVIAADDRLSAESALRTALEALSDLGRARPHLYRLMFAQPAGTAHAAATEAASRAQDVFLTLVARSVGSANAQPTAGVLMAAAHGLTDLDISGHLPTEKWHADRHQLIDLLIRMMSAHRQP